MNAGHGNGTAPIRVFLIEKHALYREALKALVALDPTIAIVGESAGFDAIDEATNNLADVVVASFDFDAETANVEISRRQGSARWLFVTGNSNPSVHVRAVQLGATGIISKNESSAVLTKAIKKIHAGEAWFDRSTVAAVLAEFSGVNGTQQATDESVSISQLTEREQQVIALIAEGLKNRQIAERLFISEATVRHHLTSIYGKLGVADRLELIIFAFKHNLGRLAT
jgi:two-component system, NarL family, nitrate/nitrite response regulator NarL